MPSLGPLEILVVLVVALVVFGPQKLPELGRQLGRALREFQKVQDNFQSEIHSAFDLNEPPRAPAPPLAAEGTLGGFDRQLPPPVLHEDGEPAQIESAQIESAQIESAQTESAETHPDGPESA